MAGLLEEVILHGLACGQDRGLSVISVGRRHPHPTVAVEISAAREVQSISLIEGTARRRRNESAPLPKKVATWLFSPPASARPGRHCGIGHCYRRLRSRNPQARQWTM